MNAAHLFELTADVHRLHIEVFFSFFLPLFVLHNRRSVQRVTRKCVDKFHIYLPGDIDRCWLELRSYARFPKSTRKSFVTHLKESIVPHPWSASGMTSKGWLFIYFAGNVDLYFGVNAEPDYEALFADRLKG